MTVASYRYYCPGVAVVLGCVVCRADGVEGVGVTWPLSLACSCWILRCNEVR